MPLLLLKDEAARLAGCELLPPVDVATPVAGRLNFPRTVTPPLTSSVLAGVVVPIPILTVAPFPVWLMAEFSMSVGGAPEGDDVDDAARGRHVGGHRRSIRGGSCNWKTKRQA